MLNLALTLCGSMMLVFGLLMMIILPIDILFDEEGVVNKKSIIYRFTAPIIFIGFIINIILSFFTSFPENPTTILIFTYHWTCILLFVGSYWQFVYWVGRTMFLEKYILSKSFMFEYVTPIILYVLIIVNIILGLLTH